MSTYAAKQFLLEEQRKGRKYFTNCDNIDEEGRCLGHEVTIEN